MPKIRHRDRALEAIMRVGAAMMACLSLVAVLLPRCPSDAEGAWAQSDWREVALEDLRREVDMVAADAPAGSWKVASTITANGAAMVELATWSRAGEWSLFRQVAADRGPEARHEAEGDVWMELFIADNGSGILRGTGQPSRLLGRARLETRWDALGLIDQSLAFLMSDPSLDWDFLYRDARSTSRREVDDGTTEWRFVSQSGSGAHVERTFATRRTEGRLQAVRFELFIRPAGDDWREKRRWSRRVARVESWKDGMPSRVVTTIEGESPDEDGVFREVRALEVRSWEAEARSDLQPRIESRGALQPREQLIIDEQGVLIQHGSRVFSIGQRKFVAPEPILEVPRDLADLMRRSREARSEDWSDAGGGG